MHTHGAISQGLYVTLALHKRVFLKSRKTPLELIQKERGILPPYEIVDDKNHKFVLFDDDFIARLDRFLLGGIDEFYPLERDLYLRYVRFYEHGVSDFIVLELDRFLSKVRLING